MAPLTPTSLLTPGFAPSHAFRAFARERSCRLSRPPFGRNPPGRTEPGITCLSAISRFAGTRLMHGFLARVPGGTMSPLLHASNQQRANAWFTGSTEYSIDVETQVRLPVVCVLSLPDWPPSPPGICTLLLHICEGCALPQLGPRLTCLGSLVGYRRGPGKKHSVLPAPTSLPSRIASVFPFPPVVRDPTASPVFRRHGRGTYDAKGAAGAKVAFAFANATKALTPSSLSHSGGIPPHRPSRRG
jgi:hypothetical protein